MFKLYAGLFLSLSLFSGIERKRPAESELTQEELKEREARELEIHRALERKEKLEEQRLRALPYNEHPSITDPGKCWAPQRRRRFAKAEQQLPSVVDVNAVVID